MHTFIKFVQNEYAVSHIRQCTCFIKKLLFFSLVPDRPRGLQPIEFGTSNVNLTWDEPDNIQGPKTIYYVQLSGNEVQTNDTTIVLMKEDGVIPGARQTIGVSET